jgi:hypothetical protein
LGKKKARKQYISKGIIGRPSNTGRTKEEKIMDKLKAWKAGKPVKLSVPSVDNKHINEKIPAVWLWGNPNIKRNLIVVQDDED